MDTDPLPASPLIGVITLAVNLLEFHAPASWATWIVIVAVACVCLMLSAFVSGSEIAYFGLTSADIDTLKNEAQEKPQAKTAVEMLSHSERLLATILISNNLVNITMVVLLTFAIQLTVTFYSTLMNFLLQTVFLTFLLLLFGEIFPKLVAKGRPMAWVMKSAPALHSFYRLFGPLARFMVRSTTLVNRIVTKKHEDISTEELEAALEISEVKEGKDKEMLEGILTFGEKEVSDIMTPRVDVTAIELHCSWQEAVNTILETGYSRIPVYDSSVDEVKGILYSKDLLPYLEQAAEKGDFEWQSLIRKPYYVPDSRMIDDLLEDFRKRRIHIAIVIDEYGATQGIVTLEDILEEIVGEIDDEYDEDETLFKRIGEDTWMFDAKIPIVDFCRITDVEEEELGDTGDAETLAGLLLEIKGDFPKEKEALRRGRFRFLVLDIEKHRITRVRVNKSPQQDITT